ncbi:MAG: PEP-CTERM sorting domain-containing protein [Bryobacteraceae bacterium]
MKSLVLSCLAIAAIALIVPRPADAAAVVIGDALVNDNITFGLNDFEGGFTLDGALAQMGLNNPKTVTVPEASSAAAAPIIHTFSADWITGVLVPATGVIAFAEAGTPPAQGVSDILTYTYSAGSMGGHLTGTFESDVDPKLLPLPAGATVVQGESFDFSNGNITALATSDIEPVPEPSTFALLGAGLLGLGFVRLRSRANVNG